MHFNAFDGKVTRATISKLISGLKPLSSAHPNMCFVGIADYNDCQQCAASVYPKLERYLNDLIGKVVTVTMVKSVKFWDTENYYTLTYRLSYVNQNPDYPVDVNWDTIDLGIENDVIKDVMHSREWYGLSEYVKN